MFNIDVNIHKQHSHKVVQEANNTIFGPSLSQTDNEILIAHMIINKNEAMHYIWSENGWANGLTFSGALVGITDTKIFKYEKGKLQCIKINSLQKVSHSRMGIFKWDKLIFHFDNNLTEWFGIYHSNTCEYFMNFINERINFIKQEKYQLAITQQQNIK